MSIENELRKVLRKVVGYDFIKFTPKSHPLARRKQLLAYYEIDTVLDIGANSGQFGKQLRKNLAYTNRILSFEPLSAAFGRLKAKAGKDPAWEVFNFAIGDTNAKGEINIAG